MRGFPLRGNLRGNLWEGKFEGKFKVKLEGNLLGKRRNAKQIKNFSRQTLQVASKGEKSSRGKSFHAQTPQNKLFLPQARAEHFSQFSPSRL